MEVTIVEREPMTIVGWAAKFIHARSPESNAPAVIGNLWRNTFKYDVLKGMPGSLGHPTWGVIWGDPVPQRARIDELNYLAGVPFAGVPALSPGLSYRAVPAGSYARITHRGPLSGLPQTIEHLYADWLPGSGYEHAGICDLELYDERFFKEGNEQAFDYFISVRPAAVAATVEASPQVTIEASPPAKDTEETGKRSRTFNEAKKTDALRGKSKPKASGSVKKQPAKKKTGAESASDRASKKKTKKPARKPARLKAKKKAAKKPGKKSVKKPAKKPAKKAKKNAPKKPAKKSPRKSPKKRSRS